MCMYKDRGGGGKGNEKCFVLFCALMLFLHFFFFYFFFGPFLAGRASPRAQFFERQVVALARRQTGQTHKQDQSKSIRFEIHTFSFDA